MDFQMPKLISFAVYDGIPPKEEGQDPIIFWYYPPTVPINSQLNEIGLYMTFTGFCRDFRSSQDCEFFQTDKSLTVFANMGSEVFAAACFESNDNSDHRNCLNSIKVFNKIYGMFFPPPKRLEDDTLDNETQEIFNSYLEELINVFRYPPFLYRMAEPFELWTFCEEIFADIKSENPHFKYGAIFYNGKVVHNSISPIDLLCLILCYRSNMPKLYPKDELSQNSEAFKWVSKNFKKPLKFSNTDGIPVIFTYQNVLVILIFSDFSDFSPIQKAVEPLLQKSLGTFYGTLSVEENQVPYLYHEEHNFISIWPSKKESEFENSRKNENRIDFLGANNNQFVRFCGTSNSNSWTFLERGNDCSTFANIQGKSMNEAMSNFVDFKKSSHF